MKIKDINTGINWRTMPKVIEREYATNGHIRSETHVRNAEGKMDVTYGEITRPVFGYFGYDDLNFYVNDKYRVDLNWFLDRGISYDEDLNNITRKETMPFFIEYSKGFNKGYSEYEDSLKNSSPLFGSSNEQIAYKVYSRVKLNKRGSFPMYAKTNQCDTELEICKGKPLNHLYYLSKPGFYQSGIEGGEFYKAWEIILNNPTVFEPIFTKYSNSITEKPQQSEPEPLDLSDTSSVEKIIYLNELGIIDFIRSKSKVGISNGGLSSVLSAITGVLPGTIKPSLNRLDKKEIDDNKHPYYKAENVDKVKKRITDLGF